MSLLFPSKDAFQELQAEAAGGTDPAGLTNQYRGVRYQSRKSYIGESDLRNLYAYIVVHHPFSVDASTLSNLTDYGQTWLY